MGLKGSARTALGIAGLAVFIVGCATTLDTRCTPPHPQNNLAIELRMDAHDRGDVAQVRLYVYEYELYVSSTAMAPARKRNGGIRDLVQERNYPTNPQNISETPSAAGFPAGPYINYLAETADERGHVTWDRWTSAAGDRPLGNSLIPIRVTGAPLTISQTG